MNEQTMDHRARRKRSRWRGPIAAAIAALAAVLVVDATDAIAQTRPGATPSTTSSATAPSSTGVVDVNSATEEQLVLLPGIGPSKARAILATRQRMGRFRRVEDLLRVRGIGRATLRRIRPMITVQGGTTLTSRPATSRRPAAEDAPSEE